MVEMLNRCDRVLAVSDFVRRKFEVLGPDGPSHAWVIWERRPPRKQYSTPSGWAWANAATRRLRPLWGG